jgi:hypothetical protein
MPICNACGNEYIEGALYCGECGVYLLAEAEEEDIESTARFLIPKPTNGADSTLPFEQQDGFEAQPDKVLFTITSSGRRVALELGKEIRIGRVDPGQEIWPELDLTPDQGYECGVSRCHAILQPSAMGVELVDCGSTNGTQLNSQHLNPEQPRLLKNGDHIKLGGLLIQVFFES